MRPARSGFVCLCVPEGRFVSSGPVTVERREPPTGTAVTGDLALRLAVAEAELKALKDMVTELRAARDAWQSQAERLALPAPPPPMTSVDQPVRRPWWKRLAG